MSRTVLLCRVDGHFGGVERFILSLLPHLDRTRYTPVVVCIANDAELARQSRALGVMTEVLPMRSRFFVSAAAQRLAQLAHKHGADLIHTFGLRSNTLAWYTRRELTLPWIIRLPNLNWTDYKNPARGWASHRFNNHLIRQADALQVISPQLQAWVQNWDDPPDKIFMIPNGVDLSKYSREQIAAGNSDIRAQYDIKDFAPVIGSIGRLDPIKGYDVLIKAYAEILKTTPAARLMIVGEGKDQRRLNRLCKQLALPHPVIFTGYQQNPAELLGAMDVFVISSHSEGVPNSMLEAMAAGLPVVSTKVGAIGSVLQHDNNGLLVDPGNINVLSGNILDILNHKEKAKRLGQSAYETILNRFSVKQMAAGVQSMYDEMIKRASRKSP